MARGVAGGVGASKTIVYNYGGPQLSRQNQKRHGKNKIPHDKTKTLTAKYFTAKTKYLTAKANTRGKTKAILFLL